MAISREDIENIKSWSGEEDVGALNHWLDSFKVFEPVISEHGFTRFEGLIIYLQVQQLDKLASIKRLLEEADDDGDAPHA